MPHREHWTCDAPLGYISVTLHCGLVHVSCAELLPAEHSKFQMPCYDKCAVVTKSRSEPLLCMFKSNVHTCAQVDWRDLTTSRTAHILCALHNSFIIHNAICRKHYNTLQEGTACHNGPQSGMQQLHTCGKRSNVVQFAQTILHCGPAAFVQS